MLPSCCGEYAAKVTNASPTSLLLRRKKLRMKRRAVVYISAPRLTQLISRFGPISATTATPPISTAGFLHHSVERHRALLIQAAQMVLDLVHGRAPAARRCTAARNRRLECLAGSWLKRFAHRRAFELIHRSLANSAKVSSSNGGLVAELVTQDQAPPPQPPQ